MPTSRDNIDHDNLNRPDWLLFLRALKAASIRFKLWGSTWLVVLLLALVPAMQTSSTIGALTGSRYPTAEAAKDLHSSMSPPVTGLSAVFRHDHSGTLGQLDRSVAAGGAALALFALLFGVFAAGGWLQVTFEQPDRQTLRRFGFGGARYFGRFLRVAVMVLLLLALVRWVFYGEPWKRFIVGGVLGLPEYDRGSMERLESEMTYTRAIWVRDGLAALTFAKVLAWGLYTRTRIALRDGRSAIAAGIATWFTMVRHPIQTLRPLILLFAVEALIVLGVLGWWAGSIDRGIVESPTGLQILALFGVVQLGVLWRQVTRGAYYHAAGRVSQSLIRPTVSQPDPWADTIGGPGGPQYPVDDDGYHVTV